MIAAAFALAIIRFFFAPGDPVLLLADWGLLLAGLASFVIGGAHDRPTA